MRSLYILGCRVVITAIVLIAGVSAAQAQALTSEGTEFWLAFTPNVGYANEESLSLVISSKEGASVTVTANPGKKSTDSVFSQTLTLAPNELKVVYFPKTLALDWNYGYLIDKSSIHVTASAPISVYGRNVSYASTDGYLGLPKQTLGQEYYLITYKQLGTWPPYAKVVATEDDTEVTFTPVNGGKTADGVPIAKGASRTLTLQQGETALFYANGEKESDISGSRIFSKKPVAVIAGQDCANVPVTQYYCDHLDEMMPPVTALGYSFIVVPTKRNPVGDYVRVVAIADGTAVYLDGQLTATLSKSEVYEFLVDSPHELKINRPAMVAQFMRGSTVGGLGDPSEMLLVPSSQFLKSYHLATFQEPTSSNIRFRDNFLNVVIPSGAISTFKMDGASVDASNFFPVAGTNFSWATLSVALGGHQVEAAVPFGIYAYGLGIDESYALPGGMAVKVVNDTSDPFSPNVRLVQVGAEMHGLATDSNDINANGMLDQNELMWGNTVGPRSEDANMNGVADAGEDLNGNGKLDRDLGLKSIELGLGSSNLELEVSPFSIGDIAVPFVVRRVDGSRDGLGTVLITDVSGNVTSAPVGLVNSTVIRNVRVTETLARDNIDLDLRSFATPPTELHEYPDRYEIEWFYPVASALSDLDLSYEVTLKKPVPGETRVVGRQLMLEYEDGAGNPVSYVIGPQSIRVLKTALDMTAALDKGVYIVGENAILSLSVKNLGLVTLYGSSPVCVQLRDKEDNPLGGWQTVTTGVLNAGGSVSLTPQFNLSQYMIGSYDMHVELSSAFCGSGEVYKRVVIPFDIADKPGTVAVNSGLKLDGAVYRPSDRVLADTSVRNLLSRGMADGYSMRVQIVRPDNSIMSPQTRPVPNLVPLNQWADTYPFWLKNEAPGVYTVVSQLLDQNKNVVETRSSRFSVQSSSESGFGLTGSLTLAPDSVPVGATVLISGTIHNRGNEAISGLPLTLYIVNPSTDTEVTHFNLNSPALTVGAKHDFEQSWLTQGKAGDAYLAVLGTTIGNDRLVLASSSFTLTAVKACHLPQIGNFPPVLNAPLQSSVSSEALGVSGMGADCEAPIWVSEGMYSINNGPFTTSTSTVKDGDLIVVRMQSPAKPSTSASLTLTVGSVARSFNVTTQAQAGTCGRAYTIGFEALHKQPRGKNVLSNSVIVSGLGAGCSVTASVQGGYLKVVRSGRLVALAEKSGARAASSGGSDRIPPGFIKGSITAQDGDVITLLQKTSTAAKATTSVALVLGDSIVPWTVATAADDASEPQSVPTLSEFALALLALLLVASGFALRPARR